MGDRRQGALARAAALVHEHRRRIDLGALMTSNLREGPIEAIAAVAPAPRRSWREKRQERRRRRRLFEEILGWILVPAMLFGAYWLLVVVLTAVGTSPSAVIQGIDVLLRAL